MDKTYFKLSQPVQALFLLRAGKPREAYSALCLEAGLSPQYSHEEYLAWARRR